ncbi:MAG: Maf family nucleotide pyrophosphatase [Propionibacteriaceae bacterium]|jgi:septum formation protein|nr:Maf family nucleotide pyrophosphatase [Propionibacteriaceae bacterium]
MRLVLASQSPARLQTLRAAGLHPEVVVSSVDEASYRAPTPAALAALLAQVKGEAVFAALGTPADTIVIGCDSILDFEGRPVGKPGTPAAATALLKRTRGRSGVLVTGHHVIVAGADVQRVTRVGTTVVHVADLTDEEIEAYVATGEPEHVAGGFTIDGLGGAFIAGLEGDPHNVVGLSLPLVRMMLADCGVRWTSLWTA